MLDSPRHAFFSCCVLLDHTVTSFGSRVLFRLASAVTDFCTSGERRSLQASEWRHAAGGRPKGRGHRSGTDVVRRSTLGPGTPQKHSRLPLQRLRLQITVTLGQLIFVQNHQWGPAVLLTSWISPKQAAADGSSRSFTHSLKGACSLFASQPHFLSTSLPYGWHFRLHVTLLYHDLYYPAVLNISPENFA